ncbi:MAG: FtsQ-type POTRA domain-containing protein [Treponema sp.]|nr:FtsQ-type POTRA domain-containing protein [Treponema sp.]
MGNIGVLLNNYQTEETVPVSQFEITEKKEEGGDKKLKIIKIVFGILCFFLVAELIIYKYVMPAFSSPKVTFSGQKLYSAEEIAEKLLPMNSTNWVNFSVSEAVALLSSEPGFDNVMIEKKFPDKIYINVVEREPVALTFVMDDGFSNPVQIDKNGVLFPVKDKSIVDSNVIPIISGLPVEHMSGGMRIPSKYRPLIDQIYKISSLGKNYFAGISEICVLPKDTGNYELELIPSQSKVKVLTDRSLNEDALKYMMVVLDVVNKLGTEEVSEIDLRYGSVSCKIR